MKKKLFEKNYDMKILIIKNIFGEKNNKLNFY